MAFRVGRIFLGGPGEIFADQGFVKDGRVELNSDAGAEHGITDEPELEEQGASQYER